MPACNLFDRTLLFAHNTTHQAQMKNLLLTAVSFLAIGMAPAVAQDDCEFEAQVEFYTAMWGAEISWEITNDAGDIVLEGANYEDYDSEAYVHCFEAGCYQLHMYDSFGDGWNAAFMTLNFPDAGLMFGDITLEYGNYDVFNFALGTECEFEEGTGGDGNGNSDVHGCTDPEAVNFNPAATIDDGSCIYACEDGGEQALLYLCTFSQGNNVALEITDEAGEIVYSGSDYGNMAIEYVDICLGEGCYTATLSNTAGEGGWYNGYFYINYGWEQIVYATLPDDSSEWSFEFSVDGSCGDVFGCTNPEAPNYNPEATVDDGTCLPTCECDDEPYEPVCGMDWLTGELITFDNLCELECIGAYLYWEGDCADQPIYGCMDPDALNYDPDATVDSGCLYPIDCEGTTAIQIFGVADSTDEWGNVPFASWYITDFNNVAWYNYVQYQNDEGIWVADGCIEDGCYNFTVYAGFTGGTSGTTAVVLDGETTYYEGNADAFQTTYGLGINVDGCEPYVPGCTDEAALNYDPNATEDNGSCIYPVVCEDGELAGQLYICTFSQGWAVGLTIEDEEGNVLFDQQGFNDMEILYLDVCVDLTACYTATLTNLAGEASWYGGYFYLNAGWDQLIYESLDDNASTEVLQFSVDGNCGDVLGCTDPDATNYSPEATIDNGSCVYPLDCEGLISVYADLSGGTWINEVGWALLDDAGTVLWEGFGAWVETGQQVMETCVPPGCYTLVLTDTFGDGWDSTVLTLTWGDQAVDYTLETGNYGEFSIGIGADCNDQPDPIAGCMDGGAINYDPLATEDDGSCEFAFCPTNEVTFVTVTLEDGLSLGWNLSGDGDIANVGGGAYASNTSHTYTACLVDDCYSITMWDMNADGWNGGWIEVWMNNEMMTTATMEDGFMSTMQLGINADCDDEGGIDPGFWLDPIGFAPYPNPTEGETNLNGSGWDQHLPVDVEVRDIAGRLVHKRTIVTNGDNAQWVLRTDVFEAGMYIVTGAQSGRTAQTAIVVR